MSVVGWTLVTLIAAGLINLAAIAYQIHRRRDGMWLRTVLLGNYFIAYVLSGLSHTLRWSHTRGFYEALSGSPPGEDSGLLNAGVMTLIGLIAMVIGVSYRRSRDPAVMIDYALAQRYPLRSGAVAVLLLVICGVAYVRISGVVSDLQSARVIAVGGGSARYVFLAAWLPWAVLLLALVLASRRSTASARAWNVLVLGLSVVAIGITQSYDGGRATLLVAAFPLLALLLPRLGRLRAPAIVVGALGIATFVTIQTQLRQDTATVDFWGLVDWQWGRFSMIAWADSWSRTHGFLHGETFVSGLLAVPASLVHFIGASLPVHTTSMVEVTGYALRGTSDAIFIVPGLTAELFANFGWLGVVVGNFVVGVVTARLSDRARVTRYEQERALIAFVASAVVISGPVAQFEAFFLQLLLTGMPLWVLWLVERMLFQRRSIGPPPENAQISQPNTNHMVTPRTATHPQHSV